MGSIRLTTRAYGQRRGDDPEPVSGCGSLPVYPLVYTIALMFGAIIGVSMRGTRLSSSVLRRAHRGWPAGVVVLVLLVGGCFDGASRTNPLDPRGEEFEGVGAVSGRVTGFYPPFPGLDGVEVRLEPGPVTAMTRDGGAFGLDRLPEGEYILTASRPGYASVVDTCTIRVGETAEVEIRLDGLPAVDHFEIQSVHISRWWPPPQELFRLEVTADVGDPDGLSDIDRVWIEVPAFGLVDTLVASATPGRYLAILQESTLPVGVESLLGHDHVVYVRDRAGVVTASGARQIARLIAPTPVALTPTSLALLSDAAPLFTWEPLLLVYPYTYRLDVVRVDENIQTVVETIENLSPGTESVKAPNPLAAGEYFWTISVVDEFGNRSRSREAGFRIP